MSIGVRAADLSGAAAKRGRLCTRMRVFGLYDRLQMSSVVTMARRGTRAATTNSGSRAFAAAVKGLS